MIVITERDEKIKEFLEVVGVADTKTIATLFFKNTTLRNAQKRLNQLVSINYIKCFRPSQIEQNIYYSRCKCRNYQHKIIFSKLLAELNNMDIEVLKYLSPYKIGDIIADGLIVVRSNDLVKIYFVEVERTKKLDIAKYERLYFSRVWKEKFPVFPGILCISNKNINTDHKVLGILQVKFNLSDINKLKSELI